MRCSGETTQNEWQLPSTMYAYEIRLPLFTIRILSVHLHTLYLPALNESCSFIALAKAM